MIPSGKFCTESLYSSLHPLLRIKMVKVVVGELGSKKSAKNRPPAHVKKQQLRASSGRTVRVFTIDANSPTFDEDLTYVYSANVAHARRENRKMFGSSDGLKVQGKTKTNSTNGRQKG